MKGYLTIGENAPQYTEIINKSKFISSAKRVDTAEEAVAFVSETAKKHRDAAHNCYAYVIENSVKFSDDGEPGGTAGMPILDSVKKNNLDRVCVVVTRYFGGIKLGAGGLVRAYSGGAAGVLAKAEKIEIKPITPLKIILPYGMLKAAQKEIARTGKIISTDYGEKATLTVHTVSSEAKTAAERIYDFTNGRAEITFGEEFLGEYK